jgi:hypothetical protein
MSNSGDIVILTRFDLIAPYIGQTEFKTLEVLNRNRGKHIIIEGPIANNNDIHDFGHSAMHTIRKWEVANPDEKVFFK